MRKHEEAFATSARKRDIQIARSRPGLSTITKAEVSVSDIGRFMRGRSFASLDEANAFIKKVTAEGSVPKTLPTTDLERAQDIIYRTCDASPRQRLKAAREALAVSPDCADAYVILAEAAKTPEDARRIYEDGVAAGERALGPKVFTEEEGHFWGVLATRPYMRARSYDPPWPASANLRFRRGETSRSHGG